jgi:nucleotide-binding universal stress UspA family protein
MCDGTHIELGFEAKDTAAHVAEDAVQASHSGVYEQIVVAVGPSTSSETYGVAAMISRAASSEVSLVHAGAEGAEADIVLSGALDQARHAGVPEDRLMSELRTESPATSLAGAAADAQAGLMILGRGGDRLARLPRQVVHRSPCDVLVVAPRGVDRTDRYRRVLIATDGSATADRAAGRGYDLARTLEASVDIVFVGHPATGELIVADTISLCGSGVPTEVQLLEGNPAKRILETAEAVDADLVVVGNKGLTGVRMLPGESVPGAVLKGAGGDVLVCRTVRQLESELEPGDGGVIERNGEPMAAFVDDDGDLHLMSARCPHLGCTVAWNPSEKTFDCPCHGSRFGPLGEVVDGPSTKPLRPS